MQKVRCPVMLMHSVEDELISISHSRVLMARAKENFSFVETKGTHNCSREVAAIEKALAFISEMIEEKPYDEEGTEDIMPSINCMNNFSIRNYGLRKDTEKKNNTNQYFKLAQKALKKNNDI